MTDFVLGLLRAMRARFSWIANAHSRLRDPYYRLLEHVFPRGIRTQFPDGHKYAVHPRFKGWSLDRYEPEVAQALLSKLKPGAVMLDIGAHVGFHTLMASRRAGDAGRVFAVEASSSTAALLRKHLEWNGANNVTIVQAAASSAPGRTVFHFRASPTDPGACANSLAYEIEGAAAEEVDLITLDDLLASEDVVPNLVKIDVEGAEMRVLEGAQRMLRGKPELLVAIHPGPMAQMGDDPKELVQWMKLRGYRAHRLDGSPVCEPEFEEILFRPSEAVN